MKPLNEEETIDQIISVVGYTIFIILTGKNEGISLTDLRTDYLAAENKMKFSHPHAWRIISQKIHQRIKATDASLLAFWQEAADFLLKETEWAAT